MSTIVKNLQKSENNAPNEVKISESSKKKDANLQSHSTLYFQIGLILCLLGTYGLFEMNFKKTMPDYVLHQPLEESPVIFVVAPKPLPKEEVKQRAPEKKVAILTDKPPIIKDNTASIEPVDIQMPDIPEAPSTPPTVATPVIPTTPPDKPFNMKDVEKVPVFPGCESASDNEARKACMSEKLAKLIQKKFNTDLASELGLKGIQKIQVEFTIDNKGNVTNIKTRSPYAQLEKEAERVVGKIPVMTPGMQRETPVSVVYNLPIVFQVL